MLKQFLRTPESHDRQFSALWVVPFALACTLFLLGTPDATDEVAVSQAPPPAQTTVAF